MANIKYKEVEGDLITMFKNEELDVIVHGANCHNVMGAGIARQISLEFPDILDVDKKYIIPVSDVRRLGNYSSLTVLRDKRPGWIVNAYTQYNTGKNLDYNALELVLKKLNFAFRPERVGLPLIGCGIAGGNWSIVKKVIQRQLKDCDVTIAFLPQDKHILNL